MTEAELALLFEAHRAHLRGVAYRMLGSVSEAEDVVQEAWFRLGRVDATQIDNLGGWLTTVVARLSLDALRARKARREQSAGFQLPEPVISRPTGPDPEQQALLAESVGLALMVVLDTLTPPERVAFVLHDAFGVPFEEIAPLVDRTPEAARQLASRSRRRVHSAAPAVDVDLSGQRRVVEAFLAAARAGDLRAVVATLDPDVVVRNDFGRGRAAALAEVHGAEAAAAAALTFRHQAAGAHHVLINGTPGLFVLAGDRPYAVLAFTIAGSRITEIFVLADPERLARLDMTMLDG